MTVRRLQDPATGEFYDVDLEDEDGPKTPQEFGWRRQQEKAVADAKAAADGAARELAFLRAGIDPTSSKLQADFVKAYDGEVTVEAIKAAAAERGFVEVGPAQPQDPTIPDANAAQDRISAASVGSNGMQVDKTDALRDVHATGDRNAFLQALAAQGVPISNGDELI